MLYLVISLADFQEIEVFHLVSIILHLFSFGFIAGSQIDLKFFSDCSLNEIKLSKAFFTNCFYYEEQEYISSLVRFSVRIKQFKEVNFYCAAFKEFVFFFFKIVVYNRFKFKSEKS